jgi:hypothetical protein
MYIYPNKQWIVHEDLSSTLPFNLLGIIYKLLITT